jgi:hypothetical protein
MRSLLLTVLAALFGGSSLIGCGRKGNGAPSAQANQDSIANNPASKAIKLPGTVLNKTANMSPAKAGNLVRSFAFVAPAPDWTKNGNSEGDGAYTKASFAMSNSKAILEISSVGLPTKGEKAIKLVEDCETGFAKGIAQHAEMAREWVSKGFSISRYADSGTGKVSVWCISNTCKVRLDFAFGAGPQAADNIKKADLVTNAFFEENPTGGAVLK